MFETNNNTFNFSNLILFKNAELELWPNKILIMFYFCIFLIGILGNLLIIFLFFKLKKMQSLTNKFISNLAFADLLVICLLIPENLLHLMLIDHAGGALSCKFTGFIHGVSLGVSVMTLTAISIDRYYIIYKPMKARTQSKLRIKFIIGLIWILSILIMSPLPFVMKYEKIDIGLNKVINKTFSICKEEWYSLELKLAYNIFLALVLFLFPIFLMSFTYLKVSQTLSIKEFPLINVNSISVKYTTKKCEQINGQDIIIKEEVSQREISFTYCSVDLNNLKMAQKAAAAATAPLDSLYYQLRINKRQQTAQNTDLTPTSASKNENAINNLFKSRRRVVRLLVVLVVLFFISWMPYHIISITIDLLYIFNIDDQHFVLTILVEKIFPFTLFLAHTNSAQNPICFFLIRKNFTKKFFNKFRCCKCCCFNKQI